MQTREQKSHQAPLEEPKESGTEPLRRVVFWSSTGVALGGLGAGVTGALLLSSTKRELARLDDEAEEISQSDDSSCLQPSASLEQVCSDLERGAKRKNTMGALMIGGFAAAGVGTLGAVVTHFFWPDAPVRVDVGVSASENIMILSGHF